MEGMSADDEVWLELNAPNARETAVPPAMHPVPVEHLPPLEQGTQVTVRVPGPVWLIDELWVSSGPHLSDGEQTYQLTAVSEPGAGAVRPRPAGGGPGAVEVFDRTARAADMWVYRDETKTQTIYDLPARSDTDWLDRVSDGSTPPVRYPRPARDLPLLSGQRIRVPTTSGGWAWYVAVSEPMARDDEIVVGAVAERHYWQAVYGAAPTDRKWLFHPLLHTCWAY